MNNKDSDGDHPNLGLQIDEEAGRIWLYGQDDPLAIQTKIFKACLRWLYLHPRGLTREVLEEIVRAAMAEAFAAFHTKSLPVYDALLSLQRSLNRLRAQEDRRRRFEIPQGEFDEKRADPRTDHNDLLDRDFWLQAARLIERHMFGAMLSLSTRDQDILACSYGLEEVGDPVRPVSYPVFPSADAEKRAVTRARRKFNHNLESMLVAELNLAQPFDRPLYEAVLRLVRGGKLHRVLALLEARHKKNS
jgi:hypothetical protein